MAEYKVLITTSGLGSRLGNLTDYTNKSLVRIGDKPAISYIIESYPIDTDFVITLGYFGSHVKQFLLLAYPNHNFTFIEVDKYKGEGSSLGYSLLQCKNVINKPFIFHASDTIVKNFNIPDLDKNWIIGSYKEDSSQYRTLNLNNNKLIKINEKGELGYDYSYIGVAGIKDYELFFIELEKLINDKHIDTSDVHAINNMLLSVDFYGQWINNEDWYDVGNTTELIRTKKFFKSSIEVLDKKDESIFFFDDFVIKFFFNKEINKNRVIRAKHLKGLVPEIIDSTENFYKYKKAAGKLFSKCANHKTFLEFLEWSNKNLWVPKVDMDFKNKCFDFYINKTKKRISEYLKDNPEPTYINGEYIPDVYDLIDTIDIDWLCNGLPSQFHGDFILDNIIKTEDSFCLIDWRQDFAGNLEIGDVYYDLAKLYGGCIIPYNKVKDESYILLNEGLTAVNYSYSISNELLQFRHVYERWIETQHFDLNKIKLITGLIFLNMSPLHTDKFSKMLWFKSIELLSNVSK